MYDIALTPLLALSLVVVVVFAVCVVCAELLFDKIFGETPLEKSSISDHGDLPYPDDEMPAAEEGTGAPEKSRSTLRRVTLAVVSMVKLKPKREVRLPFRHR